MGGKRRRRGRELQLYGFSLPKIVARQCHFVSVSNTEFVKTFFAEDTVI
jgi:hypothetical protein